MQNTTIRIKKSYLLGVLALLFWIPLPILYINPPQFLLGQPLAIYAIVFFLAGMTLASLALSFVLKSRISAGATRMYSMLFLFTGIGIYQLSGLAPNWSCFGKQIYVATANAAGQNCTTTCTNNKTKPCSGWSTCWDKFVSCDASGYDQDGRPCAGCCFSCTVVCETPPPSDNPPTITSSISCSQDGNNGWCIGTGVLTLTASDPQGYSLTISGDIGGAPFTCEPGNTCFQPLPQGNGVINYKVDAVQSGKSASGSTSWKLDATPPAITGTLSGTLGSNNWYLGSVTYNGSASDSLSGLANLTCRLDGTALGPCNSITADDEGTHIMVFTARDKAGNSQSLSQKVSIDTQNPVLTSNVSGTLGSNNWYNSATLNASASDPAPGSGLSALDYNLDNSGWTSFPSSSGSIDLPEGKHEVVVRAMDKAGRVVNSTKSYWLDETIPDVTLDPSGTLGSNNWYTTNLMLAASASDSLSGLDIFEYSLNNSAWITYTTPLTLNDGLNNISFWAQDSSGLVRQVDETYNIDTLAPQIAGSLSGVPGTNGWYISDVTISTSAIDPVPGSGLEALTYILNGSAPTLYTDPIIITDGLHTIQFDAQDQAGLTDTMTQTVMVDTTAPILNIESTLSNWSKGTVALNGTSSDSGSGLSMVDISTDGFTWQTVDGTTSWNYDWNTTTIASGSHQVHVRTTDMAGLTTEKIINAGVDNREPTISLSDSWFQWETVTLDVWDSYSGLSKVHVEISDPEGRWQTRELDLDINAFPMGFKWDRRFGDGTVAPPGTYKVKVTAHDNLGNPAQKHADIKILLGILPAGPTATPQPYIRPEATPTPVYTATPFATSSAVSTPVTSAFGSTPKPAQHAEPSPAVPAVPRAVPTKATVTDWLDSIFVPNAFVETITNVSTPEPDNSAFQNATYAALLAAVTVYVLAKKREREEEGKQKANSEKPLSNLKKKIRAAKTAAMKKKQAEMDEIAQFHLGQALEREENLKKKDSRLEQKESLVEAEMKSYTAKPQEWEAGYNAYMAKKAKDAWMKGEKESYVSAPKEQNWWEKTKSFVKDTIVQPVNLSVYQPVIKPMATSLSGWISNGISSFNQSFYQPVVKPAIESTKEAISNGITYLDNTFYQPFLKPAIERDIERLKAGTAWVIEHFYQPIIKPRIEQKIEEFKDKATWVNEHFYQPIVKPAIQWEIEKVRTRVEWVNNHVYQPIFQPIVSTINEYFIQPFVVPALDKVKENFEKGIVRVNKNIYQPIFAPVVNDINKYIYQPLADVSKKAWDKYGEWVHGSLDAVGFIPGLGEVADGVNGLIYLGEGRYIEASVSALAMIPIIGDLGKAGKWTVKAGAEVLENTLEKVAKDVAGEVAEKFVKETAEEVSEKVLKETAEEIFEKTTKETIEQASGRTIKETSEVLANKVVKESLEESVENASSKALAKSVANTVEKTIQKTAVNVLEKAAKDTGKAITSASVEKASKKVKDKLVEQAIERVDDKTAALVRSVAEKLGDDVVSINKAIALVQKHGDGAVKALKAVEPDAAAKVLRTVDGSILDDVVQQGPDAFAAFSGWAEKELTDHGKDLAARAAKDAEVLNDVKTLISKGPIDPKNLTNEQKLLIEKIAANSTFFVDGNKVVVGKWVGLDGGFLLRANETGSLHYSPHPDLWANFSKLENQGEAAWLINKQVIQTGIDKGLPFEYTLDGIPDMVLDSERDAIEAIFSWKPSDNDIMQLLKSDYIPVRIRELQELSQSGYKFDFNDASQSYMLSLKKGN